MVTNATFTTSISFSVPWGGEGEGGVVIVTRGTKNIVTVVAETITYEQRQRYFIYLHTQVIGKGI